MSSARGGAGNVAQWISCPGCSGDIGVPVGYPADVVRCPKCAAMVQIDRRTRVLCRPPTTGVAPGIDWQRQRWIFGFIFGASLFLTVLVTLTGGRSRSGPHPTAPVAAAALGIAAAASIVCWCV